MNRKMYWGVAALIIILIAAGGFIYWQWSEVQQLKEQLAQDERIPKEKSKGVAENKPPRLARAGYKWEWHEDHWHEMPIVPSDAPVAVKPKRSKGPPLNINWEDPKYLDWTDPRTAESYRNYYGFDPPTEADYFKPVQDNFGNWIKHYRNTSVIVKWGKRIGFRPTVDQLARYKRLQAELELAKTLRLDSEPTPQMQSIQQKIRELVDSAQGEIPTLLPRDSIYYGEKQTPEMRRIREAEARKALYKQMGIEHLYEFYEVDPYKEIKNDF